LNGIMSTTSETRVTERQILLVGPYGVLGTGVIDAVAETQKWGITAAAAAQLQSPCRQSPVFSQINLKKIMRCQMSVTSDAGLDGEYAPSPDARVREQVRAYESSGGTGGATLEGRPVVIVTSLGAKSGKVRKNPVMRIVDGDRYVAVASAGGSPKHPGWYHNLVAHPLVRLQDGAVVREFRAREVTGDEKTYFWAVAERFWPHFPEYRASAQGRDIPIMVLEPAPQH
jgi:F420H(2)-dependent quinone reductase